jgi:hypothetical protein
MTDNTQDIVLRLLQAIQEEQATTSRKLGTQRRAWCRCGARFQSNTTDLQSLSAAVATGFAGLRSDIHTPAIAIDSQGDRLELPTGYKWPSTPAIDALRAVFAMPTGALEPAA